MHDFLVYNTSMLEHALSRIIFSRIAMRSPADTACVRLSELQASHWIYVVGILFLLSFSILQARYCMYGSFEAGATRRIAQVSYLLRVRRDENWIILRIPNCMKCSYCFAFLLKTVASICQYLLHYSSLHLHDHSALCMSFCILPPLPAGTPAGTSLFILYDCLSLRPCQKWVVSGLWHPLPSLLDFRVLSKRGNCRHPIFDRP